MHGRSTVVVDYFLTVTGKVRVETVDDPRNPGVPLQVHRVDSLVECATCRECFGQVEVQRDLTRARRTGELPPCA